MTCPACSATDRQELLGFLGSMAHVRCRYCGWTYPTLGDERTVTEVDAWGHTQIIGGHITRRIKP